LRLVGTRSVQRAFRHWKTANIAGN
jgi:hypothetical protein